MAADNRFQPGIRFHMHQKGFTLSLPPLVVAKAGEW
jgi:hypothetical protein